MINEKLNKRQIQANATKSKIYNVAVNLMEKKGFNNITIDEISKKAGVSVGAFYHYYKSKDDIFFEIYKKADDYFKTEVRDKLNEADLNSLETIVLFFKHYAKYNDERGLENISQLYNTKNKQFSNKNRYIINLLKEIIEEGQKKGEIFCEMTSEQITKYLFIVSRGVVMDWCFHDGNYDLEEAMENFISRLITIFKSKN